MTPDDRARLFEELPAAVTRRLLDALSPEQLKATRDSSRLSPWHGWASHDPGLRRAPPDDDRRRSHPARSYDRKGEGDAPCPSTSSMKRQADRRPTPRVARACARLDEGGGDRGSASRLGPCDSQGGRRRRHLRKIRPRCACLSSDAQGLMLRNHQRSTTSSSSPKRKATAEIQRLGVRSARRPVFQCPLLADGQESAEAGWPALFVGEMLTAPRWDGTSTRIEKAAVVALFVPLIISSGGTQRLAGHLDSDPLARPPRGEASGMVARFFGRRSRPASRSGRSSGR